MWISRKKYYVELAHYHLAGFKLGREMERQELSWSSRIGKCSTSGERKRVRKNHIEGGRDCYSCANDICINAALRRMRN